MINLKKGNSISLEKDGRKLENVYVGLNWAKIDKWYGLIKKSVDLDGSVTMFDKENRTVDTIYFNKKTSNDFSINHSGDDLWGDTWEDDKDNEVISINLKRVAKRVESIVIYLNSYRGHQFHEIPYAKIRLLEGFAGGSRKPFASFNLSAEPDYKGKVSMIMAKIIREGDNWKFITIGDAVDSKDIKETVELIRLQYL